MVPVFEQFFTGAVSSDARTCSVTPAFGMNASRVPGYRFFEEFVPKRPVCPGTLISGEKFSIFVPWMSRFFGEGGTPYR